MSGRRERPPSGRVVSGSSNEKAIFALGSKATNDTFLAKSQTYSGSGRLHDSSGRRPQTAGPGAGPTTERSMESNLSTNEVLRRMRETNDREKNTRMAAEIEALGEYNSFSRPKSSSIVPLRTVFLDPAANNFPRSRTRTELLKRIKLTCQPHPSYDLDNDGYVSMQDYKLAKRFDFDGNGVLDPNERKVGKRVLAEEFFKRNSHHLHIFGPHIAKNSHKKNVENLVNSYSFERAYDKLQQVERTVCGEGSRRILNCMRTGHGDDVLKHNYYTNKFDSTAWNDMDAIPRSASKFGLTEHGGSRKRMLFSRKEVERKEVEGRMDRTTFKSHLPDVSHRRINLITDIRVENS